MYASMNYVDLDVDIHVHISIVRNGMREVGRSL